MLKLVRIKHVRTVLEWYSHILEKFKWMWSLRSFSHVHAGILEMTFKKDQTMTTTSVPKANLNLYSYVPWSKHSLCRKIQWTVHPSLIGRNLYTLLGVSIPGWWFETFFIFPYIGLLIIPIDFHIFQRGSIHQPDNEVIHSIHSQT